jgi:hypothetical protein
LIGSDERPSGLSLRVEDSRIARIAMKSGISLRAVFSAAARPPVLVLCPGHSSIASISIPALRSHFT